MSASTEGEGFAPNLGKWLKSLATQPDPEVSLEQLIPLIQRRQVDGAQDIASATAHCLGQVVDKSRWSDVDGLLENITRYGGKLMRAKPNELVIGNIVRRVLGLIRSEAEEDRNEQNPSETPSEGMMTPVDKAAPALSLSTPERPAVRPSTSTKTLERSLSHLLSATTLADQEGLSSPFGTSGASTPLHKGAPSGKIDKLRAEIVNGIQEIIDEIQSEADQIGLQADVQIRPGDNVLLSKPGPAAQRFVLRLAQRRKFTVWIALSAPTPAFDQGELPYTVFRNKLKKAGAAVHLFAGNGTATIMSRINRVILEASAITGSGAAVTDVCGAPIALAADMNNVPVIMLAGIYKFSPQIPFSDDEVTERAAPPSSFHHSTFQGTTIGLVPTTVLVRAKYIEQYISNIGCHPGAQIPKIISDHYQEEDRDLHLKLSER